MAEETLTKEEEKIIESEEVRKATALFSPEAIVILPAAIFLDFLGLVLTVLDVAYGIGEIFSWISDGLGIVFFGFWILMRSFSMAKSKEVVEKVVEKQKTIKGAVKGIKKMGRGLRFAVSVVGEILPLVGAIPFWTWLAWSELKS